MKHDELAFLTICYIYKNSGLTIREAINSVTNIIHYKRCWYLLEKWNRLGFYDYGVTLDLGWFELDKFPDRYKAALEVGLDVLRKIK